MSFIASKVSEFIKLLKDGSSVYVTNNTDPRGILMCTINNPLSGRSESFNIPKTWIPICLTDLLPVETLAGCTELRQYLQKGVLQLVDEGQAQAVLESPRAQKEFARLYSSEFAVGGIGKRKDSLVSARNKAKEALAQQGHSADEEVQLHPKVRGWERQAETGEIDGDVIANEIEIHKSELNQDDLNYILAGKFPQETKNVVSEVIKEGGYKRAPHASIIIAGNTPFEGPRNVSQRKGLETSYEGDWAVE